MAKINRKYISQEIGGTRIEHYFSGSNNFAKTLRDSALQSLPMNMVTDKKALDNDYFSRLNDGIEQLFAHNGFEFFDITPNLPLHNFWADGQVPNRYGGGFVEQVSAFRINFDLPKARLTGTKTNEREQGHVKEEKIFVPAYAFQYTTTVTEFEKMKYSQISYDIFGYRVAAMRLAYQLERELFAFVGNLGVSDIDENSPEFVPGLFNQGPDVALSIDYNGDWFVDYNVEEFVKTIIGAITLVKNNMLGATDKYPNMMIVGSDIWQAILQPAVIGGVGQSNGAGVAVSIYEYLQRQVSALTGQPFLILENFYLNADATEESTTAGIVANGKNNNGMIVIQRYDDLVMRRHTPLSLTAGAMFLTAAGYQQNHVGLETPPLVVYPTIVYINNGAKGVAPTE